MAEIPDNQLCSGLQHNVRGSDAAAPPGSLKPSLKAPHADHEVVNLYVPALLQVSQNFGDLSPNLLLVVCLCNYTVGLSG